MGMLRAHCRIILVALNVSLVLRRWSFGHRILNIG